MRGSSLLFAAAVAAVLGGGAYAANHIELPPGPNRDLVYGQCRTCHDLQYLEESAGITRDDWDQMLISMRQYGLRIPAEQRDKILDYLGTYLGPNPPPKGASLEQEAPAGAVDGAAVFKEQCSACHQANGQGVAGNFPPLAGNRDLFLPDNFVAHVVLFGLEGPLDVEGKHFASAMPPFSHLSDAQIAAVIQYVQSAWGNADLRPKEAEPISADAIARIRKKELEPAAVLALRRSLK